MGMGAADVVPGVSGGTIALIVGIYEELIDSLRSVDAKALKLLFSGKIKAAWAYVNANFLIAVLLGVAISVVSLARGISWLLENHPIALWSFFFGLILASAYAVGRRIRRPRPAQLIILALGIGLSYYITIASPAETPEAYWFIFISGMVAICAMILPGISGSFILLLLGKYAFIMGAIKDFELQVMLVFMAGAAIGLLSFSRVLGWLLQHYHDLTLALLTGFMLGSLNKVWPWKLVTQTRLDSKGEEVPFLEESILPGTFEAQVGDPQLGLAIGMFVLGIAVILVIEQPWRRPPAATDHPDAVSTGESKKVR
ncbi:MAG: DUF368 domain-containing protein [Bacteroidota bacterium]